MFIVPQYLNHLFSSDIKEIYSFSVQVRLSTTDTPRHVLNTRFPKLWIARDGPIN